MATLPRPSPSPPFPSPLVRSCCTDAQQWCVSWCGHRGAAMLCITLTMETHECEAGGPLTTVSTLPPPSHSSRCSAQRYRCSMCSRASILIEPHPYIRNPSLCPSYSACNTSQCTCHPCPGPGHVFSLTIYCAQFNMLYVARVCVEGGGAATHEHQANKSTM